MAFGCGLGHGILGWYHIVRFELLSLGYGAIQCNAVSTICAWLASPPLFANYGQPQLFMCFAFSISSTSTLCNPSPRATNPPE